MNLRVIGAVLIAAGLVACSKENSGGQAEADKAGAVNKEAAATVAQTNSLSDTLASRNGNYRAVFVADAFPAVVGENQVMLDLLDSAGNPVEGAGLSVEPWMPAHNHGSDQEPGFEEVGGGTYRISGISYTMPGLWELRIHVKAANGEDDFVVGYDVPRPSRNAP